MSRNWFFFQKAHFEWPATQKVKKSNFFEKNISKIFSMQDIDFIFFVACFGDIHLYSTNKAHIKSTFSLTYSSKYIFVPLFTKGL